MRFRCISMLVLLAVVSSQCPSKQVSLNGSCLACHYTCSECTGLSRTDCASCELEYFMDSTKVCQQCPLNCRICSNGANCSSCNTGFYLDYNQWCHPCPNGTATCTMSSIGLCQPGYYLSNLGYSHCTACTAGCSECANSTACATCLTGYLSNGLCLNCSDPNCLSCYGSDYCQACIDGHSTDQYGKCSVVCSAGCRSCVSPTVCLQCVSSYYLEGYSCFPGGPILCQSSISPTSCLSGCLSGVAYMSVTGNTCIISSTVNSTTEQYYLSALNNITSFWQAQLVVCPTNSIAYAQAQLLIMQSVKSAYRVLVSYQLYLLASDNQPADYSVSSPFSNTSSGGSLAPSTSTYSTCGQFSFVSAVSSKVLFNISTMFNSSAEPFQILFSTQPTSYLGISQLVISASRCGVSYCGSCSTAQDCLACEPPYYLQINSCVTACSFGLYTNPVDRTCLTSCPDLYYSLRQEYQCALCKSPCRTCSSSTKCTSCINGTYLTSQATCVSSCNDPTLYGNPSTLKCESCIYPCKQCSGAGNNCTGCLIGFLNLNNNTCTLKCPDGFYGKMDTLRCDACVAPCLACTMSNDTCTACIAGLSLSEGACLPNCPTQTFSLYGVCQQCEDPCLECTVSSLHCMSCKRGFLLNSSCLYTCPDGTYGSSDVKMCMGCDPACLVCLGPSSGNCSQCQPSYVLFQLSCLGVCPQGYYNDSAVCATCKSPCSGCTSPTTCTSCQLSFYFFNGTCSQTCPNGSYLSTTNNSLCVGCPNSCTLCSVVGGAVVCTQCSYGTFLQNGQCGSSCPQATFPNALQGRCDKCAAPCLTCSVSVDRCLSCVAGYSLLQQLSLCFQLCPTGFYNNTSSTTCQPCLFPCSECRSGSECTACSTPYYLYQASCLLSCPNGTYASDNAGSCVPCTLPCSTCLSQKLCLSCQPASGYPFLYIHSCLSSCPIGSIGHGSSCTPCGPNCEACISTSTNCTSCTEGYFLYSSDATCLAVCPTGYFASGAINSCSPCKQMCSSCLAYSYCTSCVTSPKAYLFDSGCYYSCPSGYFSDEADSSSYICASCDSACRQCSLRPNNCTVCKQGTFMPVGLISTTSCLSGCPALSFAFNSSCLACSSPCQQCTSPDLCITCESRYVLFNQSCLSVCPIGYFNSSGICSSCELPCLQCSGQSTNCSSCVSSLYLFNHSCLSACPGHYYASQLSNICLQCSSLCQLCLDQGTCLSCNQTSKYFLLEASTCVESCSQSYYLLGKTCLSCSANCVKCTNSTTCLSCTSSYLFNGSCVRKCLATHYSDISLQCLPCQFPCATCLDSQTCSTCSNGYLLYLTYCITKCPDKYWADRYSGRCVAECAVTLFRNLPTMECFSSCPVYYTADAYCVNTCTSVVNRTMGCEDCSGTVCDDLAQFKAVYAPTQGKLMIAILFSKPLTRFADVTASLFSVSVAPKMYVQAETETIQRLLSTSALAVQRVEASCIWLSVNSSTIQTSQATVRLINQSLLLRNDYPLQNVVSEVEVSYYRPYSPSQVLTGDSFFTVGRTIAYAMLILVGVNYLLDNCRATVVLTESVQTYYLLGYLRIWYCPVLEQLLRGFEIACFRIELPLSFEPLFWDSRSKNLTLSTDINFFRNCLGAVACCLCFLAASLLLKLLCRLVSKSVPFKHEFCWNHLNDCFWLFGYSLAFFAFFQFADMRSLVWCAVAASVTIGIFVVAAALLFYTAVKCVFNKSFSEATFFWALDTTHVKNSLGHMTAPLLIIRRIIVVFSIGIAGDNPLYCLFLLLVASLLVIFNNIINSPYKRHSIIIIVKEVVFAAIVLVLGCLAIFTMDQRLSWNVGVAATALLLLDLALGFWIVIAETHRAIKKIWQRSKNKAGNDFSPQDKHIDKESQLEKSEASSKDKVSIFKSSVKIPQELEQKEVPLQAPSLRGRSDSNLSLKSNREAINVILPANIFESSSDEASSDTFARPAEYLIEMPKGGQAKEEHRE